MLAAILTLLLLSPPLAAAWLLLVPRLGAALALPAAALGWSTWAVATAELLPVTRPWMTAAWGVPALAAVAVLVRRRGEVAARARRAPAGWRALDGLEGAGVVALALVGALTLLTALVAVPNNWDSMVYHLARVEMWKHLGEVAHYATHVEPQLYQPPGSELLMLPAFVIADGDTLANLVQWGAWLGCTLLGVVAAAALGARRRGQLAAAVLVGTTPLAILQASSTQNDLLLAMWLLLAATLAVRIWSGVASSIPAEALLGSLALGMAVLTKGTGALLGLPIGLLLLVAVARRLPMTRTALLATVGLTLLVAPNVGQWSRNHETYGAAIAADHGGEQNPYRVDDPGVASVFSNLVRNATNHMDLPFEPANRAIERATVGLLDAVGIDASDPRTTFLQQRFRVGPFGPHEDHAGSLLLLVLGVAAAVSTVLARRRREPGSGVQLAWLLVVAAQVLLFAALITWQNWHVRMHLPMTVAAAALVAVRLGARRSGRLLAIACVIAILMAPLYVLLNVTRPLVGEDSILTSSRAAVRYQPRPQLRQPFAEVVQRIGATGVERVGLVSGIDDWQYPLLRELHVRDIEVEQVLVTGPSSRYAEAAPLPDALICLGCTATWEAQLSDAGLAPADLEHDGERPGRGDDVASVDLWLR